MNNTFSGRAFLVFIISTLLGLAVTKAQEVAVPTIEIESAQIKNTINEDSTFKEEKVDAKKLNDSNRTSLFDVLKDQPGVDTQVYCANCGAKRLSINGLKAEHTSILVDGLPLHSAISSFYGVDNIPPSALKDITVMRGTGASLTNPEAIGGTINLITIDPLDFHHQISFSVGLNDNQDLQKHNQNFTFGYANKMKTFGVVISGQFNQNETWDEDENFIAELPERENYAGMVKARYLMGKKNDITLRFAHNQLTILGGAVNPVKPVGVRDNAASQSDFEDGSVEKKYFGDPSKITDWISTNRTEYALNWLYLKNASETIDIKAGFARNEQKAIYQHGFDYSNIDNLFVSDVNYQKATDSGNIFKLGLFYKDQRLRSASVTLFDENDIPADSFDYWSIAPYASYSVYWDNFEIDLALRVEKIKMDWKELSNEIDDEIFAPRFMFRHSLTDHLTQRFSYGYGYRAPLTFFESQHGNEENGYQVDIHQLEKAHSFVYSLSYNTPTGYITGGLHYTILDNMAFGYEEFNQPILYQNTSEKFNILVADILFGYKPIESWLLELSLEYFDYEDEYTIKLPTAVIEKRATLSSNFKYKKWEHDFKFIIVPSRDLSRFGSYSNHYVARNEGAEPTLDSNLEKKDQEAPTFFTIDTSIQYSLSHHSQLRLSVENLLDYTQASEGDSPATWHWHFNHAHYDGLHTWGPNAGRTVGLSYNHKFH